MTEIAQQALKFYIYERIAGYIVAGIILIAIAAWMLIQWRKYK